jgi:hypothetical protein
MKAARYCDNMYGATFFHGNSLEQEKAKVTAGFKCAPLTPPVDTK